MTASSVPLPTHPGFRNLTGQRFGMLEVVSYVGQKYPHQLWLCRCDCGKETIKRANNLLTPGHTNSCGCLFIHKRAAGLRTRHGQSRTPEWNAWMNIKARCYDHANKSYHNYGGRGITVCPQWLESFEVFRTDVGPRPSAKLTLERIDNNRGYEPGNCRWATRREQNANTRRNRMLTVHGETKPLPTWAHQYGLKPQTLWARLKSGWSDEKAVLTPLLH